MRLSTLIQRWGLFAATVFFLLGVTLAYLEASPVTGRDIGTRYAFWMLTAAATFLSWWLSQWLVVSGREQLTRRLLLVSCLLATLLFVPVSVLIDMLFGMPDGRASWLSWLAEEWLDSALPVFASCMIASLPAWLSMMESAAPVRTPAPGPVAEPDIESLLPPSVNIAVALPSAIGTGPSSETPATPRDLPIEPSDGALLPRVVRGGVLRATADLQYVHLYSPEGITTIPGPLHRVMNLLGDQGLEVRRGEWIADRHVKQVKSVRGRWVVLLKDDQQVVVSRRRLPEVKKRWGSTRYL